MQQMMILAATGWKFTVTINIQRDEQESMSVSYIQHLEVSLWCVFSWIQNNNNKKDT